MKNLEEERRLAWILDIVCRNGPIERYVWTTCGQQGLKDEG